MADAKEPPAHETSAQVQRRTSDHLANERTFLAWVRTSISVIGLGFVVARFSVWIRQLSSHLNGPPLEIHHTGLSLPMGVGMMSVGALFAIIAASRYHRVRRAIDSNEPAASGQAVTVVTLLTLAIAASLVVYMLATR